MFSFTRKKSVGSNELIEELLQKDCFRRIALFRRMIHSNVIFRVILPRPSSSLSSRTDIVYLVLYNATKIQLLHWWLWSSYPMHWHRHHAMPACHYVWHACTYWCVIACSMAFI